MPSLSPEPLAVGRDTKSASKSWARYSTGQGGTQILCVLLCLRKPATQEVGHGANRTLASNVPPRPAVPCPMQVCHIPRGARPGCSRSPGVGATQLVACRHMGNSETGDSEPPTTRLSQSARAAAGSPAPTGSQGGLSTSHPVNPWVCRADAFCLFLNPAVTSSSQRCTSTQSMVRGLKCASL